MTKTVACYCIARKYLFGTFGHLTFEFVSNFDIRYSDFEAVVFSPRAKLDYTIPPCGMGFGHKLNCYQRVGILLHLFEIITS
jgi:hypothetical protein